MIETILFATGVMIAGGFMFTNYVRIKELRVSIAKIHGANDTDTKGEFIINSDRLLDRCQSLAVELELTKRADRTGEGLTFYGYSLEDIKMLREENSRLRASKIVDRLKGTEGGAA